MWTDALNLLNQAIMQVFGVPGVLYSGGQGSVPPVSITVYHNRSPLAQSSVPGFWADIEVNPLDIPAPQRKDLVTWPDGTAYFVNKVTLPIESGMWVLSLHTVDK